MNPMPSAIVPPLSEVVVYRLVLGIVLGEISPGTAGAEDVENGVDHLAQVNSARTTTRLGGRH